MCQLPSHINDVFINGTSHLTVAISLRLTRKVNCDVDRPETRKSAIQLTVIQIIVVIFSFSILLKDYLALPLKYLPDETGENEVDVLL